MIKGYKPSGYFVTYDKNGRKVEGETRQCAHCQFTWVYVPDTEHDMSPYLLAIPEEMRKKRRKIKRGYCLNCQSLLCGSPACMRSCAPYQTLALEMVKQYTLSPSGVFIKKQ